MKKMKKIFALLIAMVMVLGMSTAVFAGTIVVESGTTTDGDPSQDVLTGETYNAYKILNFTSDTTKDPAAYSYYLTADEYEGGLGALLESVGFEFTISADETQYVLSNADDIEADVAADLYAIKDDIATVAIATATETATGDKDEDGTVTATFEDLDTGYWFVTSSMGALCSLQSFDDQALIVEKNSMITDDKEVDENSENAQVGDILTYTITLTDGSGTNLEGKIIDTMSKGLTYNGVTSVTANGVDLVEDDDYTVSATSYSSTTGTVVTYTFTADVMTALEAGQQIIVTYTATVNDDASIDGTVTNTEVSQYSNQETDGNEVEVELTDMTVNKTDGTDALKGAQFKLYRTDEALELDHVDVLLRELTDEELEAAEVEKAENTVYYTVDPEGTNLIDMAQKDNDGNYLYSSAVVYGLDKDSTYFLEETKAPEGYNLLDEEEEVNLGEVTSIDVVNNAGSILPSTGGIGTTIFYVIGAILVIGAGVVLVTRRRMNVQ